VNIQTIPTTSCTSQNSSESPAKRLAAVASHIDVTSILAKLSAASLVIASAGLGAYYSWNVGNEHGALLGSLFVLFAVGLELAKPLSIVAAFKAVGSWQLVRGGALSVLAVVAIAYSLSAELSLMAGSRGDVVAERQAALNASADTAADRKRVLDRQTAAETELSNLAQSRPAAEVQAEIDGLLLTPGADNCSAINGRVSREVCPKVAALRIEKARAGRRGELEAILATPLPAAQPSITASGKAVRDADPGSTALATYLAALGFVVPVKVLSDWLSLVPVIALELGSALSGLLVLTVSSPARNMVEQELGKAVPDSMDTGVPALPAPTPALVFQAQQTSVPVCPRKPDEHDEDKGGPTNGARLGTALLGHLRENGGKVQGGQRGLAKLLGTSTTELNRTLRKLADAGLLLVTPDRLTGTTIELRAT
jgi:hypothetical protein